MSGEAPKQRDEAWLEKATPEQIVNAHDAGELHVLQGLPIDEDGWPLNEHGKRVNLGPRR